MPLRVSQQKAMEEMFLNSKKLRSLHRGILSEMVICGRAAAAAG